MKYSKQYQEYMKKITDIFVGKLTHNTATPIEEYRTPSYKRDSGSIIFDYKTNDCGDIFYCDNEAPDQMDGVVKRPRDVVEAWMKIENECALRWLTKNAITYDEWVKKHKPKNNPSKLTAEQVYEMYTELNKEMHQKNMLPLSMEFVAGGVKYPTKEGYYFVKYGWNDKTGEQDVNEDSVYKL